MRNGKFMRIKALFLAAALSLLFPIFATAQAVTIQSTATEVFNPLGLPGIEQVGTIINPGTLICPGSQPTGDPLQPCPPGRPIHLRGVSGFSRVTSGSPLLAGWIYWEINANWNADAAGPVWGSFRLDLDAGGVWEGSYTNDRSKVQNVNMWIGRARFVGRGTSGPVEGMQLRFTEIAATFSPLPVAWAAPIDAEVLAPPSR